MSYEPRRGIGFAVCCRRTPRRSKSPISKQSAANEWNFTGTLNEGLKNADFFEVVIGLTANKMLVVSSYPHYKGNYINVDKARNSLGLLRQIANLSYRN